MTFIRAWQRTATAVSPHNANSRYLIPKRKGILLEPPGLTVRYDGAITPGESVAGDVTRTGFDSRTDLEAMGTLTPLDFNGENIDFLFYHWDLASLFFGNATAGQFGMTATPIVISVQGFPKILSVPWNAGGSNWRLDSADANEMGKHLRANIGNKLAVVVGQ